MPFKYRNKRDRTSRDGIVLILCMFFVAVFSAMAVGIIRLADTNVQLAANQQNANRALAAAQSGIECGKYFAATVTGLPSTWNNTVSRTEASAAWAALCSHIQAKKPGSKAGCPPTVFTDLHGSGMQLIVPEINIGTSIGRSQNPTFVLRFFCYDREPNTIKIESIGTYKGAKKKNTLDMKIRKSADVLKYAIVAKGRVWITGNSIIHGDICSSWKYQNLSPFNIEAGSAIEGTIHTRLTKGTSANHYDELYAGTSLMPYRLETLDEHGNPLYDLDGNKIIGTYDEIQGRYQAVNYGSERIGNMAGMKLSDYDTSLYKNQTTEISTAGVPILKEYFPHNAGDYTTGPSGSLQLNRYEYQNQTFSNKRLPSNSNALFKDCTFNGILYIDCGTSGTGQYNNVRFENCVFNGPIVTNTPNYSSLDKTAWWEKNCLYFTGEETFQNNTDIPAAILAPNFNVNLGNTNPTTRDENALNGVIVGGIVDIRGNAQVYGTVISMYDTSIYPNGYVSNIGATLDDGGSETTESGDAGRVNIIANPYQPLPGGIAAPIEIRPVQSSYSEI